MKDKNTLIPVFQGGLGNQLFVYSCAKILSLKYDCNIASDNFSGFKIDTKYNRSYKLDSFNLNLKHISKNHYLLESKLKLKYRLYKLLMNFQSDVSIISDKNINHFLLDGKKWNFFSKNMYMYGNFQLPKILNEHRHMLLKNIQFNNRSILKSKFDSIEFAPNDVCIHLRLFKDDPNEFEYISKYIQRAIKLTKNYIDKPKFFIISESANDIQRLNKCINEDLVNLTYLKNNEVEDLFLLTQFRNLILSESTFSWWGAFLSGQNHRDGVIVCSNRNKLSSTSLWKKEFILDAWYRA